MLKPRSSVSLTFGRNILLYATKCQFFHHHIDVQTILELIFEPEK